MKSKIILVVALILGLVAGFVPPVQAQIIARENRSVMASPDIPAAPTEVPKKMEAGIVHEFTIADPVIYWYTRPLGCAPNKPSTAYPERIGRTPTYGGSLRLLLSRDVICDQADLRTNLIADGQYLYWISKEYGGLVRLSKDAGALDTPELMVAGDVNGDGYLSQHRDRIYFLKYGSVGSLIWIDKNTFDSGYILNSACTQPCGKLVVTTYNYYVQSGLGLLRFDRSSLQSSSVDTYVASFDATDYTVWYTKNKVLGVAPSLFLYDVAFDQKRVLYTSPDPNANFTDITKGQDHVFFVEAKDAGCSPLLCHSFHLQRVPWSSTQTPDTLVSYSNESGVRLDSLHAIGEFIFFRTGYQNAQKENVGDIYRFPQNAAALPVENMWVTGMEITQGIQSLDNQQALIVNRRTFVRLHVRSKANAIPGVSAYLYQTNESGAPLGAPLTPVNPAGKRLTVLPNPNRDLIDQSFLFELPWSWLSGTRNLKAELNPGKVPLEPDYGDNVYLASAPFNPSPRLETQFVAFGYRLNNTLYYPSISDDIIPTYSFIRRTYPLASNPGNFSDPSPGFRPNLWLIEDEGLDERVNQTHAECRALVMGGSDPQLCASTYVNGLLRALRVEENIDAAIFMYGMISDGAGFFPRGREGGSAVSSGPAGTPNRAAGNFLGAGWDFDTTYGDWYAAHEIGHSLGRAHPVPNSDNPATSPAVEGCGHSRTDAGYPYPNAEISPAGGLFAGFDVGDGELGLPVRVIPGNTGHDVMSYCNEQWLSNYTYWGIYSRLVSAGLSHDLNRADTQSPNPARLEGTVYMNAVMLAGDFLNVTGFVGGTTGALQVVRRVDSVSEQPLLTPGGYSLRLLNGSGGSLAEYAFTPLPDEGGIGSQSFHQVVNYVAGAAELQLVRLSDGAVLDSRPVSANPPVIGSVALLNPPDPVTGTVTLTWNASDADGDALTFDVSYSQDGGLTYLPLQMGLTGSSTKLDTSRLSGSAEALFLVVASDGVHTAAGRSPIYQMADKPPQVRIVLPEDNLHIQYGQAFNLAAAAENPQGGTLTYSWKTQYGKFASGAYTTIYTLGVGENIITVTATNEQGLSASASITVWVNDDLQLPGPSLAAGPDRLSWHLEASATSPLSQELAIYNTGSGDLAWEVSDPGLSWVDLESTSGAAPATIQVTVDPSGLAPGKTYTTELLVSSSTTGDSVTIPVALSVGDVWNPQALDGSIYLPLVVR